MTKRGKVSDVERIERAIQKLVSKAEFKRYTAQSDTRVDQLDKRLDQMVTKTLFVDQIDRVDSRIDILDGRIEALDDRLTCEVDRLDKRIEIVVGEAEDRLIGKMADMESRIMRHIDSRFDELAAMIARSHQQLADAIAEVAARPY